MENKAIIVHHNDMDGIFSGALIYDYEKNKNKTDWVKCIEVDYTINLNDILKEDVSLNDLTVYFVDYSFSKKENVDVVNKILNNGNKVVWIDHHKSSENVFYEMPDNNENIVCIVNTEYCAAVLCYEYITSLKNDKNILKYVNSWDIWKHDMINDREFKEGFTDNHYTAESFGEIIGGLLEDENKEQEFIYECISKGKSICNYLDDNNESLCKSNGFEFRIDYFGKEIKCFALNQYGNSTVFGNRINEYDIVVLIKFNGDQFVYSLYSNKDEIDCSEIASALGTFDGLGGGGHKGAAGFQVYENIIYKDNTLKIYKSFGKTKVKVK